MTKSSVSGYGKMMLLYFWFKHSVKSANNTAGDLELS